MTRRFIVPLSAALALGLLLPFSSNQSSAWSAEPVNSMGIVDAKAFLEQYRSLSEAQSDDFYDLYSDRAVVHAHIEGEDKGVAFQGRVYKQWGRDRLKNARGMLDSSVFRDATVEQRGDRLVLRAKRYSTMRCYWDTAYQVGIEKEGVSYRIVDERLTTNPRARCEAGSAWAPSATVTAPSMVTPVLNSHLAGPSAAVDSSWHPMSQEEIAATAMRIAQQAVANTPSQGRAATLPLVSAAPALTDATIAGPASAPARSVNPRSELWITPQE